MNDKIASFCLVTYNHAKYVEEALISALNQTYSPLEIVISDDASSDETTERIDAILRDYSGPHKVIYNRNPQNLGIRENLNKVLYDLCNGEFIFLAGGDDISDPRRVEACIRLFEEHPKATSISCLSRQIDINGQCINVDGLWSGNCAEYYLEDYASLPYFTLNSGDSRAVRRCVVESFDRMRYSRDEDLFLFVRSLYLGSALYIRQPLVDRRQTGQNATSNHLSNDYLKGMSRQLLEDLDAAYEKSFIEDNQYEAMKRKISYVVSHFELYDTSPYSSFKVLWHRLMRRYLGLTRYFPGYSE